MTFQSSHFLQLFVLDATILTCHSAIMMTSNSLKRCLGRRLVFICSATTCEGYHLPFVHACYLWRLFSSCSFGRLFHCPFPFTFPPLPSAAPLSLTLSWPVVAFVLYWALAAVLFTITQRTVGWLKGPSVASLPSLSEAVRRTVVFSAYLFCIPVMAGPWPSCKTTCRLVGGGCHCVVTDVCNAGTPHRTVFTFVHLTCCAVLITVPDDTVPDC